MTRSPFAGLLRVHGRRELLRSLVVAFVAAFVVGIAAGFGLALLVLWGRP